VALAGVISPDRAIVGGLHHRLLIALSTGEL
jgi:hypothetical protein